MIDFGKIAQIRRDLDRIGCASTTSPTFQNQVLSHLDMNADRGDFLIEVGCFRGGMSTQLAHFAVERGKQLFVVDVDPNYMAIARGAVESALGSVPSCVHFVLDSLPGFLAGPRPSDRCILVFIDGDHHYEGVAADIRSLIDSSLERPFSVCFHDYGLRYTAEDYLDVRVDRAIHDLLPGHPVAPIGEVAGNSGILPTSPQAHDHGSHFPAGMSEGVIVDFRAERPKGIRPDSMHRRLRKMAGVALPAGLRRALAQSS